MHKLEYKKEVWQIENVIIKNISAENSKNQLKLLNIAPVRVIITSIHKELFSYSGLRLT